MRQFWRDRNPRKALWLALIAFLMGRVPHCVPSKRPKFAAIVSGVLGQAEGPARRGKVPRRSGMGDCPGSSGRQVFHRGINALYKKGSELMAAADALHCVSDLGRAATDADKLKKFDDIDRILPIVRY